MSDQSGVFLNGKAQVVEMFKLLGDSEKQRLYEMLKQKNPGLANEVMQESESFESLNQLNEEQFHTLFKRLTPPIWGLALKGTSRSFQQRILSIAPREYAQKAYDIMISPIKRESENSKRAQKKVLQMLSYLKKNKLI